MIFFRNYERRQGEEAGDQQQQHRSAPQGEPALVQQEDPKSRPAGYAAAAAGNNINSQAFMLISLTGIRILYRPRVKIEKNTKLNTFYFDYYKSCLKLLFI